MAIAAAAAGLVFCAPAAAQEQERRLERQIRLADPAQRARIDTGLTLAERAYVDAGGFFTYTFLNLDDPTGNKRRLNQYDTTIYARGAVDVHSFFVRSRFRYRDFSANDSFDGRGDGWAQPFLDRYWYEFLLVGDPPVEDGRIAGAPTIFTVRGGRQFVDWGAGLALSENLLGARPQVSWGTGHRWTVEGIAGVTPTDRSIIDFDLSRDEFNRRTRRGFFGGQLRLTTPTNQQFYVYGLHMPDFNPESTPRFGTLGPVDFDYEATYWGVGANGSLGADLLYLAEFVYQTGSSMSDPLRGEQTEEDISAFAARGQLTYQFRDRGLTRVQLETLFASGDDDRLLPSATIGGNLSGTTDRAFNSMGFANTGLAFAPSLNNLMSLRLGVATFPFRAVGGLERFQVGADVLAFGKLDNRAPIEEPTLDRHYLGMETDFFMNYRVTSDLALNLRYGAFFPGAAIAGERDARHFVLLSATLSF